MYSPRPASLSKSDGRCGTIMNPDHDQYVEYRDGLTIVKHDFDGPALADYVAHQFAENEFRCIHVFGRQASHAKYRDERLACLV